MFFLGPLFLNDPSSASGQDSTWLRTRVFNTCRFNAVVVVFAMTTATCRNFLGQVCHVTVRARARRQDVLRLELAGARWCAPLANLSLAILHPVARPYSAADACTATMVVMLWEVQDSCGLSSDLKPRQLLGPSSPWQNIPKTGASRTSAETASDSTLLVP